jgi:hypothetical protein
MAFRRALAKEDQEAFDRLFECAKRPAQAEDQLGRPWKFEAITMAVLLAHEKRRAGLLQQLLGDRGGGGQREPPSLSWMRLVGRVESEKHCTTISRN